MKSLFIRASLAAALLLVAACASAQTVTGVILGSVTDASGQSIAQASVSLSNEGTGEERSTKTQNTGEFTFPAVLPGTYTVTIGAPGMTSYRKTGNILSADARLSLGTIQLSVGSITQTVTVASTGAAVETESAEGSALLNTRQIENLAVRNRDVIGLLNLVPGAQTSAGSDSLGGTYSGVGTPNVAGVRSSANTVTIDGQSGMDLGSAGVYVTYTNFDAVDEVKILVNNYQAEYGRAGGAIVNVVTKSGTKDFHGTVYWYKRHEMFNANNFFNNASGLSKPRYRYLTEGITVGGPVSIPKVFNTSRQKLFFFYSVERDPGQVPQAIQQLTMPTALERAGNFSQSFDQNGKLIVIKDPSTGAPFPGNIIPANRINPSGQALINVFNPPNLTNTAITKGAYNYQFQESLELAKLQHLFRIDYRPGSNDNFYFRGSIWNQSTSGYNGTGQFPAWGLVHNELQFPNKSATFGYNRIVSATMINEFNATIRRTYLIVPLPGAQELPKIERSGVGFTAGQLYPQNNQLGLIPEASFGGISNAPNFNSFWSGRFPAHRTDSVYSLSDGFTWTHGPHTLKAGFYYEKVQEIGVPGFGQAWMGNFDFSVDTNNPNDSGDPYSNALLGNFRQYTEPSTKIRPSDIAFNADWYLQDSWKVNRRLTLELGLRTEHNTPYSANNAGQLSSFALSRYQANQSPVYFRPTLVGNQRLALNPITGQTGPPALIGAFVPGTGNVNNGLVTALDPSYPHSFIQSNGELLQPRVGLAYDVFGNGKTAIRAGFSKTNGLIRSEPQASNPPISFTPTIIDGNLSTFLGSSGVLFPSSVTAWDLHSRAPNYYDITLGVQQDIGFKTVLDVKYVSTLGRNLLVTENLNTLPYGARFMANNQDPTTGKALPDTFLAPFPGYSTITYNETAGSSNYHALHATANRRVSNGLLLGVSYSYSKAMDYGTSFPIYANLRQWNYSPADFDQTHVLVINYTYDVPTLNHLVSNRFVRAIVNDWQISGINTFASGTPSGVSFTTTSSADLTGGGDGQRINISGNAQLSHSDRNILHIFNTAVFSLPGKGDAGNAPRTVFRLPGFNNWDTTLFKNIPLHNEKRVLQLRWEVYNIFNHTQFSSVNTTARFDASGNQVNGLFGTPTAARNARIMQVSLRFRF